MAVDAAGVYHYTGAETGFDQATFNLLGTSLTTKYTSEFRFDRTPNVRVRNAFGATQTAVYRADVQWMEFTTDGGVTWTRMFNTYRDSSVFTSVAELEFGQLRSPDDYNTLIPQTYVCPDRCSFVEIILIGGGGNSGFAGPLAAPGATSSSAACGGGGSGAVVSTVIDGNTFRTTFPNGAPISIGLGGIYSKTPVKTTTLGSGGNILSAGGGSNAVDQGTGTNTSFYLMTNGGQGGFTGSGTGIFAGQYILMAGERGGHATQGYNGTDDTFHGYGGDGGGGLYGVGGYGRNADGSNAADNIDAAGTVLASTVGYGGGGGGSAINNAHPVVAASGSFTIPGNQDQPLPGSGTVRDQTGGNGNDGGVIIREYYV